MGCEPQAFGSFGDQTKQWAKTSGLGTHPGTGPRHSCCYSVTQLRQTLCDPLNGTTPGFQSFTISRSLLKFMSIESVMLSSHLFLCHLFLLLPLIFPSIRVFSRDSALHIRWSKYWSFGFSISPSNEYSGLISFRMDWLDLLAVQGTLKSLLQHHSSKASILWCSAFFMVQLSYLNVTIGKTIALTTCIFVGRVMSLLLNTLSRFVTVPSKEQASFNFIMPRHWGQTRCGSHSWQDEAVGS